MPSNECQGVSAVLHVEQTELAAWASELLDIIVDFEMKKNADSK